MQSMSSTTDPVATTLIGVAKERYGERYDDHLLEQYKLYLQMADKISDRRTTANTFFLTINTGLVSAIGIANYSSLKISPALMIIVALAAMVLCYSWQRILRSYRGLNSAKFTVIHEIEKHLPLRPYDAEWEAVGRGQDSKRYLPFTHVEIFVPWIFITIYAVLVVYAMVKK
jgi:hypothetical protein